MGFRRSEIAQENIESKKTERIEFQTWKELTSCFFADSLTEQQKEEIRKLTPERWINLCGKAAGLYLMEQEIEKAEQSTEKMILLSESSGSICIDTSKMEYVEVDSESNRE